ncbi:MAG: YkvA family protein [Thermoleophilia bacterium]
MAVWAWALLAAAGGLAALWLALVAALALTGRREWARALVGVVPDCAILVARLARDPRVRRRDRALLVALGLYLALPFDLVPDVVPVAGQLDDAIVVALVLRRLVRAAGPAVVAEHWPGPDASLRVLLRVAGGGRAR